MDTQTAIISIQSFPLNATKRTARTASSILGEASRLATHSRHVDAPQAPVVLRVHGELRGPEYVMALLEDRAARARDPLGRKIRRDAHVLVAGVSSYPGTHAEVAQDPERYKAWGRATLAFLHNEFGEHLAAAVLHRDETRPHLHFYVVPPLEDFTTAAVHPGQAASRATRDQPAKARYALYREVMSAMADRYHAAVAHLGLTRTGGTPRKTLPRREHIARVEREEICARKSQLARQAEELQAQEEKLQAMAAEIRRMAAEREALEKSIRDRALELGAGISEADAAKLRACGITI